MRFRVKKYSYYKVWRSWFAWHPVVVEDQLVWLERVERRAIGIFDEWVLWEYRNA